MRGGHGTKQVSRILEDSRYIGEKGYPALIEPEQLRTAAEKRTARACPPQKTPAQKTLRRLCGAPPSERVEKIVTDPVNELIRCPGPYSASGIPDGRALPGKRGRI